MKAFTNNDIEQQKENQAKDDQKSKMDPSWVTNIGEQAKQMRLHYNKYLEENDIVVLAENTLFILTENGGKIRFQKRFGFSPASFITYHLRTDGNDIFPEVHGKQNLTTAGFMTLVSSYEGYIMVYQDTRLAWTAKLLVPSIFIDKATFQNQDGLIVTMSDSG